MKIYIHQICSRSGQTFKFWSDKLTRLVVVRLIDGWQRLCSKTFEGCSKYLFTGTNQNLSGQSFTHTYIGIRSIGKGVSWTLGKHEWWGGNVTCSTCVVGHWRPLRAAAIALTVVAHLMMSTKNKLGRSLTKRRLNQTVRLPHSNHRDKSKTKQNVEKLLIFPNAAEPAGGVSGIKNMSGVSIDPSWENTR